MPDLTPPEHEHSAAVEEAAAWLALDQRERINRPIIPHLRNRFGLSAQEACEACRLAQARRAA